MECSYFNKTLTFFPRRLRDHIERGGHKDCKSQRHYISVAEQYWPDMTGPLYIWVYIRCGFMQKTYMISNQAKVPARCRGIHEVPFLSGEILTNNGCWERESHFCECCGRQEDTHILIDCTTSRYISTNTSFFLDHENISLQWTLMKTETHGCSRS